MSAYKSLSKEQRKQFKSLYSKESYELLKMPQYFIGHFIFLALVSYFLGRGLGYNISQSPKISDIIGSVIAVAFPLLILWLVNKKFKLMRNFELFMIGWGIWMFIWCLLKSTHVGPKVISYEYLIYTALIGVSWPCSLESMLKYFCNKIFIAENNEQNQDQKTP